MCKLLSYNETTKGYRLFDPKSNPKSNKIIVSRNVIFNEKIPLSKSQNLDISFDKDFYAKSRGSAVSTFQGSQINQVHLLLLLQSSTPILLILKQLFHEDQNFDIFKISSTSIETFNY